METKKNTFSFKRLVLLLNRYFRENMNREVMFWSILTLIFTILDQRDFVILVLFLSGIYYSVLLNKEISKSVSGMHYLLIPATHAEKLTATILLNTIFHFGMTLLAYSIGNLLITLIYHVILKLDIPVNWDLFQVTKQYEINGFIQVSVQNVFWSVLGIFAFIQSVFTLGSLYFKGNTVIKTIFTIFCFTGIIMLVQIVLLKTLWDVKYLKNAILPMLVMINDSTIPTLIQKSIVWGSFIILPFMWLVSYFRLSEKQI